MDYEILDGTVTFAPGETTQTIHAHIYGDTLIEAKETYRIRLSAPTNATIADAVSVIAINNDDKPPTLSIADASIVEGDAGTKFMSLTVTLSKAASGPVTVGYATADVTATAGSDYSAKSGTLTFAAGRPARPSRSASPVTQRSRPTRPSGSNLAQRRRVRPSRTARRWRPSPNDDAAASLPTLSIADASIAEGDAGSDAADADRHAVEGRRPVR